MKNGSLHKKSIFFCSFLNVIFLEKKVICTFCLAKCIRKGQKNVPFDYMKNGSHHKEQLFCSFLKVIFLEKNVICTFFLTKCIRKGQKKLFLLDCMKNGSLHKKNNFFVPFLMLFVLSRKERHLYFLPCQIHQKRDKKIVPFDYMKKKNGSHHRKSNYFCSFLKVIFLEKNVICTFCLAKCIRKGQKNCSFWLHDVNKERHLYFLPCQMHQKRDKQIVPFDYMTFKKNVICTFWLTKCIRKGQTNSSFWLHEEWLSSQKEQLFCSFLKVIFLEKNVICTFCLAKCIRKGQKNCSFWLHDVNK